MKFNRSSIDEQLWQEYHNPANADKQKFVKEFMDGVWRVGRIGWSLRIINNE